MKNQLSRNHSIVKLPSKKAYVSICILGLLLSQTIRADVRLPSIIGNNMVLQRNSNAPIWGWANPNEAIEVKASWQPSTVTTVADTNGNWRIHLRTPAAGGPFTITIKGKNLIKLDNVLSGEVWFCGGQSNMKWRVQQCDNAQQEISDANYPNIRLFNSGGDGADTPQNNCPGAWEICTPQTVGYFSGVGYFFGRQLYKELNVPIGLINTSRGGTIIESWVKKEVLESDRDFVPILEQFKQLCDEYPQAWAAYEKGPLQKWKEDCEKAKAEGQPAPRQPREPVGPKHRHAPVRLYNGVIAPLMPYGIKGVIWYQGESNTPNAFQYRKLLPALIKSWRKDWGQGDFPFYIVQLPNISNRQPEPGESEWAELRQAQLMALEQPNTAMTVIIDLGKADDAHPTNKQDVAKRLVLLPLAKDYGRDIVYSGPIYKSMQIDKNRIILKFDHTGGSLCSSDGGPLKGFAIAGADHKFIWAEAKICSPDTVEVQAAAVQNPVAVRYAWADNPECNLQNKEGLPASPFRTDDWPGVTTDVKYPRF